MSGSNIQCVGRYTPNTHEIEESIETGAYSARRHGSVTDREGRPRYLGQNRHEPVRNLCYSLSRFARPGIVNATMDCGECAARLAAPHIRGVADTNNDPGRSGRLSQTQAVVGTGIARHGVGYYRCGRDRISRGVGQRP